MRPNLPTVLSFNAGYVDTAGFLALHGLFTAHVTGNFVMIGQALAHGSESLVAKLLALPTFCVAVVVLQYLSLRIAAPPARALRVMLLAKFLFLTAAAGCAIYYGGFADADGLPLVLTGMLLVIAMAIQNAAHRLHLASAPPSTLMTGTTTQIMLDLAGLLYGKTQDKPEAIKARLIRLSVPVLAFALGCGLAALLFVLLGMWCFALPAALAAGGVFLPLPEKAQG